MTKVNRKNWEGTLLCTLNTKILRYDDISEVHPWMFVKVAIYNNTVYFPFDHTMDARPIIELADKKGCPIKTIIENIIKASPTILKSCLLTRVGYDRTKFLNPVQLDYKPVKSYIYRKQTIRFVEKILRQKGELRYLKPFIATL